MKQLARLPAILALAAALAAAFTLLPTHNSALAQGTATATATPTDYDTDDDGLIEIDSLAKLNAIRYDMNGNGDATHTTYANAFPNRDTNAATRMGCPSGACTGYELTANLDFDENGDGQITAAGDPTYWNRSQHQSKISTGWIPLGGFSDRFTATLNGNGHTINNLYMNRFHTMNDAQGFISYIGSGGRIESLGITNANVSSITNSELGIIAGNNVDGAIVACYTTGSLTVDGSYGGGLVGRMTDDATIHSSYSTASISGFSSTSSNTGNIGGLVGYALGKTGVTSITNSYATGLITRSTGTDTSFGGLAGGVGANFTATASYYDTTTSGCVSGSTTGCTGSAAGTGKTTAELQTPTGYTGIYSTWNANVDGVAGNDDPWAFGASSQYPSLILHITNDYDLDDDGLIEVTNLAQLNAIRHDLDADGNATHADYASAFPRRETGSSGRMGCPSGACTGYELDANLDFDTNGDGSVTTAGDDYYNANSGWEPIGTALTAFNGDFKGNGLTINNLYINRTSNIAVGLFGKIDSSARIESVSITNANVTGLQQVGALVGDNNGGEIVACYTAGSVSAAQNGGGLVGISEGSNAKILSSYSTASVTGIGSSPAHLGGLLGRFSAGVVTHTYATGLITRGSGGSTYIGGLIGRGITSGITKSYYDTSTSGCVSGGSNGCTGSAGGSQVVGRTTTQLKTPTGYTGIYSTWNANLDGETGADDPWNFGASTDYPTLTYGKPIDYDSDNDGYIEITTLAQLDAVRRDLNANGDSAHDDYIAAFPKRHTRSDRLMGCPSGRCVGYELDADLDFDTDGDGAVDSDDDYWNSGAGWVPLGAQPQGSRYTGNFKGNGHTINNLFINRNGGNDQGLFGYISGRIETLGVTNASVSATTDVGILAGSNWGTIVACYVSGKVQGLGINTYIGGLVGYSGGTVSTSYSTAYVNARFRVGGLIGYQHYRSTTTNSYATGRVVSENVASTGALVGYVAPAFQTNPAGTVSNSYYDIISSGCTTGATTKCTSGGTNVGSGVVGKTPRQLQTVTSYTGIYANWNANLDGVAGNDDPWDFGNGMQYPMLDYDGMSTAPQGGLTSGAPHNWNAPIVGELVTVYVKSATARANRNGAWIWERSDNGDTWETISGSRSPTYRYTPTTSDVDHFLRAKAPLNDGGFAYTRALGGRVKAASAAADATQGSAVTFVSGNTSPSVGADILATTPAPSGAVDARIGWQRCPNTTTPHTDCVYIPNTWCVRYTPVAADVGEYLRMYVYYATSTGVWTRHESGFTGQVAASQ